MADSLVHIVLDQLSSIVTREIEQKVELVVGVEKEVERLRSNLLAIQAVLIDAEKRQFREAIVKQWLDKLKVVCYDVDDVLDEWNTAILKSQIEAGDRDEAASNTTRKVGSFIRSACSCFSCPDIGRRHDIACKIQEINRTLNYIANERNKYDFALLKDVDYVERSMTASVVDMAEVKGREGDKNELKNMLLCEISKESNPHVISLVGMGGLGKTTLSKLVYNDGEVETHFQKRIWVCVSDPFDEIRVAKAILESLIGEAPNLVEMQTILQRIQQNLNGKKFLLVLDDVWEEDPKKWEQLKHCLLCGSPGSKILVTTRKESVASMMDSSHVYKLGMLSREDCWSILSKVAFFGRTKRECERLQGVAREIVDKCKGLPLSAKTLGGLLRFKKLKEEWQSVLDSDVWELKEAERDLLLVPLQLSYYDLPPVLRRCFSFCAIFPKDYMIRKKHLIELWMAQGFLKRTRCKSLNRVGEDYFQNLAMRSFFQDFTISDADGGILSFKMHDMVHDFAQFLTKDECISTEINNIPEELRIDSLRHLMVVFPEPATLPNSFYHMKKLRTLLIDSKWDFKIEASLPNLFNRLTCLRSLSLGHCGLVEIPLNINKLVHLRELDVSENKNLKELPETICELYNLQILDVSFCDQLALPHGIGKLINLSHLYNLDCLKPLPKGIRRLSGLQILHVFVVKHNGDSSSLGDLKNLNCLEGHLWIRGMENVANVNELKQAQFGKKTQISSVDLIFDAGEVEWRKSHDEVLLEALEPPPNLERLSLYGCQATKIFPCWMIPLSSLRWIFLSSCMNCELLPPLGRLPSLEHLELWSMDGVKKVGVEFLGIETGEDGVSSSVNSFPKLTNLFFGYMKNWVEWVDDFRRETDSTKVSIMPCLGYLSFVVCEQLRAVPFYLLQKTTLKKLDILDCSILKKQYGKGTGEDWSIISHIPSITINQKNLQG